MTDAPGPAGVPPPALSMTRHLAGFVVSGLAAFFVDAGVLLAAVRLAGLDPRVARIVAIAVAMVVAWLAHRRLTFAVTAKPSLGELGRYVAAASTTAAINYSVFAGLITILPWLGPLAALVASTGIATVFSYIAMRCGVFRGSR